MSEGLLPCWNCGEEGAQMYMIKSSYYVRCHNCETISPLYKSLLAAAKSWNDAYLEQRYKSDDGEDATNATQQG